MVASIVNGETGLSARNKLNELVTNNNTIENLPDGAIPMASGTSLGTSSVREMTGMIESTKPVMSTGFQSNSVMLVGAGEAITAEVASGDLYRAIGAKYTKAGGTERPGFVDTEAQTLATIQSDDTQTISGNSIQFIFASTASGIATAYTFRSRLTTAIDNCNFISRFNSHTSDNIAFDYQRDNGGTGFRIPAESENTNGEFTITLPIADGKENGVEFREDVPTYVTISAPSGETIELAGGPLTQQGQPTQQVPYIVATGNVGPVRGLLHNGDIDDTSTTTGLLTAAQIDTRISNSSGADNYVDTTTVGVASDNTVTTTLGRTGTLSDLSDSFQLLAGSNITLTADTTNGTITIASTGGTTPPTPVTTDLRYGLSSQSDPALVDFAALTDVASPTDPITISTGTTTAGQYFHILTSNTHEIVSITDTVLSQEVYRRGASSTANIFTLTEDSRTEGSITYDALSIGPLNAGVDEEYVVRFS